MNSFPFFDHHHHHHHHHHHVYSWYHQVHLLLFFMILVFPATLCLNLDGVLLQSFKSNIFKDPFGVLENWESNNDTPCSWHGVTCGSSGSFDAYRVTTLSLPNSQLVGSIPSNLGMIPFLKFINLSNNSINGSLPLYLFNSSQLRIIDLSNNLITGVLPELIAGLTDLQLLNLSDNALIGNVPENITSLHNLTVISLKNNYFSGSLPTGFQSVQFLDLSSNLINGTLPLNFGGENINYINLSFNNLSGDIPPEFASKLPQNATVDLSYNNFTGEIPESPVFLNQESSSFAGNEKLCGVPLNVLCSEPLLSNLSSPPAFAAIPQTVDANNNPIASSPGQQPVKQKSNSLRFTTILGIVVGDIAGIGIISLVFIYVHRLKKKRKIQTSIKSESVKDFDWASSSAAPSPSSPPEYKWLRSWTCIRKHKHNDNESSTSQSVSSDSEDQETGSGTQTGKEESTNGQNQNQNQEEKKGALVTVDGEKELELETLLKASAYMLGATGSSIMYKAVLEDGTTLAVRRIGENGLERFRDFENQVRTISKLVHPNLVKIRGFYWADDEKLVIYDFVPNGSLANARYKKAGSSPCHLPWEVRLKISKGVARGLNYIHEKKHIHGNLKPSNVLLGSDMEPKIGDFGLERLVPGENSSKVGGSSRIFGSKRSTASRDSFQDFTIGPTPSPSPSTLGLSPYHAPESLRSIKPNPKWDVFSFGVVLLELLTGKLVVSDETGPVLTVGSSSSATLDDEEKSKVLKMADVAIRADLEGKEEALLALLRLGYNCISPVPQKRPSMKDVLQALEKFPSSLSYHYGH